MVVSDPASMRRPSARRTSITVAVLATGISSSSALRRPKSGREQCGHLLLGRLERLSARGTKPAIEPVITILPPTRIWRTRGSLGSIGGLV